MKPKFQIGQRVFYNLPDGTVGIVTDWSYTSSIGQYRYEVVFDATTAALWYYDFELSKEKVIV